MTTENTIEAGTDTATAPIDAQAAQDWAALEAQAGAPDPAPETEQLPAVDLAAEIGGLLSLLSEMAAPAFPSLKKIYTKETIERASGAVAAVCNKHGWLSGGVMGGWAEEITAAAVLVPLAATTYAGIKADNAAREKEAAQHANE